MHTSPTSLPRSFGKYLLRKRLADGGMAEIYIGQPVGGTTLPSPLIVKVLHSAYKGDRRVATLFEDEAKIMSALAHPNIVSIFDFGRVGDTVYTAMEFVDGVDADGLIETCREKGIPIPVEAVLDICIAIARALSYAHGAADSDGNPLHVVHRDVSPHNILLGLDGAVKLCDFGLAATRVRASAEPENADVSDAIKGKLRFLSPEQARDEEVDHRSDIFSLGVVLYELLAGHHPIPSGAGVSVLRELAGSKGYPSLADAAPWLEKDLCDIVDKALRFNRDERFQTAAKMADALTDCLRTRETADASTLIASLVAQVRGQCPPKAPARRPKRPVWGRVLLLAFSCIAAISAFILLTRHRQSPEPTEKAATLERTGAAHGFVDAGETPIQSPSSRPTAPDRAASVAVLNIVSTDETATTESEPASEKENPLRVDTSLVKKPRFGFVNINAAPWADVSIDGVEYTATPLIGIKLRAGRHKAVLRNGELGVTRTRVFTVKPEETVTVIVEMQD